MTRLIYAVTVPRASRLHVYGLRKEPLVLVRVGRLTAVVGQLPRAPKVTPSNIREYHRVLHRLWLVLPAIVPARYPTFIEDLDELKMILRSRDHSLRRTLRDVTRRAQMTIRILGALGSSGDQESSAPRDDLSSGLAYLQSRASAAAAARRVLEFEALRPIVRRWIRAERVEKRGNIATIYHLVPRASAVAYRTALESAAAAEGVKVIVSGPFPPYAFSDDLVRGPD